MRKSVLAVSTLAIVGLVCAGAFAQAGSQTAELTGKVETKTENNVKVSYITVSAAKDSAGKAMDTLKGKTIKLTGAKASDAEKFNGKEAVAKGTLKDENKSLEVQSVAAKPAT